MTLRELSDAIQDIVLMDDIEGIAHPVYLETPGDGVVWNITGVAICPSTGGVHIVATFDE